MGQNVFYAVEENDCLSRQCCGPLRSFTIRVLDNFGEEIITVSRPLKCMSCFFPCCLQEVSWEYKNGVGLLRSHQGFLAIFSPLDMILIVLQIFFAVYIVFIYGRNPKHKSRPKKHYNGDLDKTKAMHHGFTENRPTFIDKTSRQGWKLKMLSTGHCGWWISKSTSHSMFVPATFLFLTACEN